MSSPRKSARLALNRFRNNEERSGFPSKVKDDPMANIFSFSDRPFTWNKDTHRRYGCTPTDATYKVLRGPGPGDTCPLLEAKHADPQNPLCCSSRVGGQTDPDSMHFFSALKTIFNFVPVQHRQIANYPPNLRRLLQWITMPSNTAQIPAQIPPQPPVFPMPLVLNTEHQRFLNMLKFAMMSHSGISIVAQQNMHPPPLAPLLIDPFFSGGDEPFFLIDDRLPLFNDLIRINNEVGGTWQVSVENYTPPPTVLSLPPIRADNVGFGGDGPMYATDFDHISAWFDTCDNNGWSPSWLNVDHRVFKRLNVNITQRFIALFNSFVRRETRHLSFYHIVPIVPPAFPPLPPVNAPAGYEPINFQPGEYRQIVTAVMNSVGGFNLDEIDDDEYLSFDFNTHAFVGTRRMHMARVDQSQRNVWDCEVLPNNHPLMV